MQVIEPTEKDQGIYSIVITDPENSHKRSLDLSGEGLSLLGLVNVSSASADRYMICDKFGPLVLSKYKTGTLKAKWITTIKKKSRDLFVSNWIHRVDFFSCGRKMCHTSQRKPQSRHAASWHWKLLLCFSPPDKAVPESGIFIFPPLHVCVTNLSNAEPCSCSWLEIKRLVERFYIPQMKLVGWGSSKGQLSDKVPSTSAFSPLAVYEKAFAEFQKLK